jgi:hypothetical protein
MIVLHDDTAEACGEQRKLEIYRLKMSIMKTSA